MANGKPFFGGVPTDIDIKRLRDAFPSDQLKEGTLIPYSKVESVLELKRSECRFKTVTSRWRRIIENELGLVIKAKTNEGFYLCDDPAKLDVAGEKLRTAAKAAKRSMVVVARTDRNKLDDERKNDYDLKAMHAAAMISTAQLRKKKALPTL